MKTITATLLILTTIIGDCQPDPSMIEYECSCTRTVFTPPTTTDVWSTDVCGVDPVNQATTACNATGGNTACECTCLPASVCY